MGDMKGLAARAFERLGGGEKGMAEDGGDVPSGDSADAMDPEIVAAKALGAAVKSGSPEGIRSAFKDMYEACYGDGGDEKEPPADVDYGQDA